MNFKSNWCCWTLWVLLIDGLWLNLMAVAQDPECKAIIETSYWCHISPPSYATVNVSMTQPGRVVCTIPQSTGLDIFVKNQFGDDVRTDTTLKHYVHQTSDPSSVPQNTQNSESDERNYNLEIHWTPNTDIQEKLRILQCEAIFHQTNYICKTSVVNINFIREPEATHAYTAQPVSTATTELPVTDCNITHNTKLNNNTVPDFGLSAQPQGSHSLKMALNHIILILSLTMSFNTN